jgi:hypothetical protein
MGWREEGYTVYVESGNKPHILTTSVTSAMSEPTSRQAGATKGRQLVRSHYLVAVTEKGIRIGRFGFGQTVKSETVVDVGNAKTEEQAKSAAVARYAKAKKVNPILVSVSQVRKVERTLTEVDTAFSVMDLDRLAKAVGAGNVATCGTIAIKVRRA